MSKMNHKNSKKTLIITAVAALVLLAGAFSIKLPGKAEDNNEAKNKIKMVKDSDILISTKDITEQVAFYPAEIKGTNLEVIAVKASDGTIRTAFNTCQVCYSSGRGYYEKEGNNLICQNCGNRFSMDDIEMTRGGCNPVPITQEYKTVSEDTITISKDFLEQATVIFSNWK